jgi:hypothetical protein
MAKLDDTLYIHGSLDGGISLDNLWRTFGAYDCCKCTKPMKNHFKFDKIPTASRAKAI